MLKIMFPRTFSSKSHWGSKACHGPHLTITNNKFIGWHNYWQFVPLTNRVWGLYRKLRTKFFSPSIYGPTAKCAGHKSQRKKRRLVTYSTYQEDKVSKIFIICLLCVWWVQEKFPFMRNGFKFLTRSRAKQVNLKSFLSRLHALVRNSETVICFIRWENLLINHTTVWQQKYFKF